MAAFDDGPTPGVHTCQISWGDNSSSAGTVGTGTCTGSHAYAIGSSGSRQIFVFVIDPGGAVGVASVGINVTPAPASGCPNGRETCTVAGVGAIGPVQSVAFELAAWLSRGRSGGQLLLIDKARLRIFVFAVREVAINTHSASLSGFGSLNGRLGFTFEASVADNRRIFGPGAPDTLRVVIRDSAGAVVQIVDGEVTPGDIAVN